MKINDMVMVYLLYSYFESIFQSTFWSKGHQKKWGTVPFFARWALKIPPTNFFNNKGEGFLVFFMFILG